MTSTLLILSMWLGGMLLSYGLVEEMGITEKWGIFRKRQKIALVASIVGWPVALWIGALVSAFFVVRDRVNDQLQRRRDRVARRAEGVEEGSE